MANSAFMIAATSSGCGKTTLSLGLMRELTRRGFNVQPFKCGPDYIDTQFHTKSTGNESINLDTFMSSENHVIDLFNRYSIGRDITVVEGVMGLFDGYSKMSGSSADLSTLLSLPVILIVNAASTAYSVAATIYGFKNFNPAVRIAGIIFNRVSSESHFSFLEAACTDAGVECLGYLRRDNLLATPSRHLGLTLTASHEMEVFINRAADAVAETVNVDRLLELTEITSLSTQITNTTSTPLASPSSRISKPPYTSIDSTPTSPTKVAAVAFDEAFNFIYPANLERLRQWGYNIVKFSPIHDSELPVADFIYIPGGYPELFANEISRNAAMRDAICRYVENGGKMWAECGGLIYLCKEIDGIPMCGILPLKCTMTNAKLTLGYRTVNFRDSIIKGHEFHYSRVINPDILPSLATQTNVRGHLVNTPVYCHKNLLASYTHLYWADKDCLF